MQEESIRLLGVISHNLRVSSRRYEIQKSMHSVVFGTAVTLDARFFSQNVVVLALEISDNFLEAAHTKSDQGNLSYSDGKSYASSLSMLSPKPGVSTIVNAIRAPSSSNSVYRYNENSKIIVCPGRHVNLCYLAHRRCMV